MYNVESDILYDFKLERLFVLVLLMPVFNKQSVIFLGGIIREYCVKNKVDEKTLSDKLKYGYLPTYF